MFGTKWNILQSTVYRMYIYGYMYALLFMCLYAKHLRLQAGKFLFRS